MVLRLRHSGEIIRGRTSPTCERDHPVTQAQNLCFAGPGRVDRALWAIPAAGLPVLATSSASRLTFSHSRRQERLHCETAPNLNCASSSASSATASFDQRVGRASPPSEV